VPLPGVLEKGDEKGRPMVRPPHCRRG